MTSTQSDDEYLSGGSTADILESTHNFTTLDGLGGADTLISTLFDVPVNNDYEGDIMLTQLGGSGADQMTAQLLGSSSFMGDYSLAFSLDGGAGNDTILAGYAAGLTIYAQGDGLSHMELVGGSGNDLILATPATTTGVGSSWTNKIGIDGGSGDDTITIEDVSGSSFPASGVLSNNIFVNAGSGNDLIQIDLVEQAADEMTRDIFVDGGTGNDTITVDYNITFYQSLTGDFLVNGGNGADEIQVNILSSDSNGLALADVTLDGGFGNDTVSVLFSQATINDDALELSAELFGNKGHDVLTFDVDVEANSSVFIGDGGTGNDTIISTVTLDQNQFQGSGLSTLDQTFNGGSGKDLFNLSADLSGDAILQANGTVNGGGGSDTINSVTTASTGEAAASVSQVFNGGNGADQISVDISSTASSNFGTTGSDGTIQGGNGADSITTDISASAQSGAIANQSIFGGSGNDFINVSAQATASLTTPRATSYVDGGTGQDKISVQTSAQGNLNNLANGLAEHTVLGGNGSDGLHTNISAFGESTAHTVEVTDGGNGNDFIVAETASYGNDFAQASLNLTGGNGHDTISTETTITGFRFEQGFAGSSIAGDLNVDGGNGNDQISSIVHAGDPTDLTALLNGSSQADVTLRINGGLGNDLIKSEIIGQGGSIIDGGDGNDTIQVQGGSDNITGSNVDNVVNGGAGDDVIVGGSANDQLNGGHGNDRLVAGSSTDGIEIWTGDNPAPEEQNTDLFADTFVFDHTYAQGTIRITDWQRSVDMLEFGTTDKATLLSWTVIDGGIGGDVGLRTAEGTYIYFEGVGTGNTSTVYDLVVNDFQIV